MYKIFVFVTGIILITGCSRQPANSAEEKLDSTPLMEGSRETGQSIPDTSITYKIIPAEGNATGFGYDIYMSGKLYVHQPTIPAVEGNRSFSTEEKGQASRAAGGF
jgi:hypothetical protein